MNQKQDPIIAAYRVFGLEGDEDFETVRYRRIKYDMQVTCDKIYNIPELDNFLGDRLLVGR